MVLTVLLLVCCVCLLRVIARCSFREEERFGFGSFAKCDLLKKDFRGDATRGGARKPQQDNKQARAARRRQQSRQSIKSLSVKKKRLQFLTPCPTIDSMSLAVLLSSCASKLTGRAPLLRRGPAALAARAADGRDEPTTAAGAAAHHRRCFASITLMGDTATIHSSGSLARVQSLLPKSGNNSHHRPYLQQQQQRWKHRNKSARLGHHLQKLDEMAHSTEREVAQERRQKKKDRKAAKKGKKGGGTDGGDIIMHDERDEEEEEEHDEHVEGVEAEEEEEHDETLLPDPAEVELRMHKHVGKFKDYIRGVRGGEPTPEMFDDISVLHAYGKGSGMAPLKSLAQVVISSPTMAVATCFDPATAKAVSMAIRDKLELANPQVEDGGVVRIPMPRASLESRQNTARQVEQRAEQFRQRVHQTRNKAMTVVKQGVAGKLEHVSKDDAFRVQEAIDKGKDAALLEINALAEKKKEDIMSV